MYAQLTYLSLVNKVLQANKQVTPPDAKVIIQILTQVLTDITSEDQAVIVKDIFYSLPQEIQVRCVAIIKDSTNSIHSFYDANFDPLKGVTIEQLDVGVRQVTMFVNKIVTLATINAVSLDDVLNNDLEISDESTTLDTIKDESSTIPFDIITSVFTTSFDATTLKPIEMNTTAFWTAFEDDMHKLFPKISAAALADTSVYDCDTTNGISAIAKFEKSKGVIKRLIPSNEEFTKWIIMINNDTNTKTRDDIYVGNIGLEVTGGGTDTHTFALGYYTTSSTGTAVASYLPKANYVTERETVINQIKGIINYLYFRL